MSTGDAHVIRDVEIGAPAHGGHCVARVDGRVVFVRHTAPGEIVDIELTDAGADRRFWRADAVAVRHASPDRVPSRWPEAGPGGVGGGELAHLTLIAQRRWKEEVIGDTLRRIGHLDHDVTVHPLGQDDARDGLGTRTRVELVLDDRSRPGMFRHRSHEVQALTDLPLAVPAIRDLDLFAPGRWDAMAPGTRLEVVAPSNGAPVVLADGVTVHPAGSPARVVRERVTTPLGELDYRVDATGFWQVHQDAPTTLVEAVLAAAAVQPGQRVVELYSGAGLLTLPLALAAGPSGRVDAVEANERAIKNARRNLHAAPQAVLHQQQVRATTIEALAGDVVVLDPPRAGAGGAVMTALAGLAPERIVYVACDPAALARDLRTAVGLGYRIAELTGYDLFPHTHHVECVAVLVRDEA